MANKSKVIYQEKYKKGVCFNDVSQIISHLKKDTTVVEILSAGKFDNGNEFITVKIIIK